MTRKTSFFYNRNKHTLHILDPHTTSTFTFAARLKTFPAELGSALTTSHMLTPGCSFNQMLAARAVFPPLFLAHRFYFLRRLILRTQLPRMFRRPTVSTGLRSTSANPKISVYFRWRHEGTALTSRAIQWVRSCDLELKHCISPQKVGPQLLEN